jgi:hypothetical protein
MELDESSVQNKVCDGKKGMRSADVSCLCIISCGGEVCTSCVSKLVWLLEADGDYLVNLGSSLRQSVGCPFYDGDI